MSNTIESPDQAASTPKPRRESRLSRLVLEGLTVLLGVFLALLADEWREERQLDAEADAVKSRLEEEIIANYQEAVDVLLDVEDRHTRLRSLDTHLGADRAFDEYGPCFIGYRFAQFSSAAWGRASLDRIGSRIDAGYMSAAAELYSWNSVFDGLADPLNRLLYSPAYFDPDQARVSYRLAERIVWQQRSWARTMVDLYGQFIREHIPAQSPLVDDELRAAQARWTDQSGSRDEATQRDRPWCAGPASD